MYHIIISYNIISYHIIGLCMSVRVWRAYHYQNAAV